MYTLTDVWK